MVSRSTVHTSHSVAATNEVSVIMDLVEVAAVCAVFVKMKRKKRRRKYWVHPIVSNTSVHNFSLIFCIPSDLNHKVLVSSPPL